MTAKPPAEFRRKGVLAALTMASVLLLSTACSPGALFGGGAGGGGSSSGVDGGNNSDGKPTKSDKDKKDEKGGDKKDDAASGTLTGKDCLPGTWIFDNEGFRKFLAELAGDLSVATSGTVTLTLRADGSAETFYDHWAHDVTIDAGKAQVERHGKDQGTYTVAANGTMSMSDTSIGSITTVIVSAGGQKIVQSIDPEPSVFSQAAITCKGDNLEIHVDGYNVQMHRQR